MTKLYKVGIYARLSTDDASNSAKANAYIPSDESASIEHQKALLSKFAMLNGWVETRTYADDGYSGGNFNRPAFKEMLEDIKQGAINLVLVKDLSRLGRDYIEVGRYTDSIFPALGCRFVSLLDGIDTANDNNDMMHFRSLMNDYHLKDLSNKIKSVRHAKAKSGQFLSAYVPYGYMRDPDDKHRLIVDENVAANVRRIFDLRMQGVGYASIAAALNNDGVISPRGYWQEQYGKGECRYSTLWMYATVKKLLHNEVYLGHLIQNCTGTLSYKDKTMVNKPESAWIRHENVHEAIISQEVWDAAQEVNRTVATKQCGARKQNTALFAGKLFCADCGSPLASFTDRQTRRSGEVKRYAAYHCSRHAGSGRSACSWHTMYEKTLMTLLVSEIQAHAQAIILDEAAVLDKLKKVMALNDSAQQLYLRREAKSTEQRINELERITAELYEDKVANRISEAAFSALIAKNEQERQNKMEQHSILLAKLSAVEQKTKNLTKWTGVIRKYANAAELDRTAIDELIDRVEIGERSIVDGKRQQDIRVFYRFVGQI